MSLYTIDQEIGELTAPVLVVAFSGWVSAGMAGTLTADHIVGSAGAIATFDGDSLFDYRANRPTIDFVEGVVEDIVWPEMTLRRVSHGGRDLLVLSGTEPNWNWRRLGSEIGQLALQLGIVEHVSVGGVPWATPHTRPTSVIMTASRPELVPADAERPQGLLRVPGAAVSIIESAVADVGIPTFGFWARVPHYVGAAYYPAVLALVERISSHLGVTIPLGSLADDAADQREQLDAIIESRPDAKAIVEQLEQLATESDAVSGESLAAEIERFLQERSPGPDPFGGDADPA